jgi:hypothetical protein
VFYYGSVAEIVEHDDALWVRGVPLPEVETRVAQWWDADKYPRLRYQVSPWTDPEPLVLVQVDSADDDVRPVMESLRAALAPWDVLSRDDIDDLVEASWAAEASV